MIKFLIDNAEWITWTTVTIGIVFSGLVAFTQIRRSGHQIELARVRLDHSRYVMEREIERLHEQMYRDSSRLSELNHLLIDSLTRKDPAQDGSHLDIGVSGTSFLMSMGINPKDVKIDPKLVFVLTPFNSSQSRTYNILKMKCEMSGLSIRRGDEEKISGPILPYIVRQIVSSRFVVANINGRNPNVFYELGIAQALGKQAILVVKSYDDVPFDLKQQQLVVYTDYDELAEKFGAALTKHALS